MPRSVGQQRVARHKIAAKPIGAPFGSLNLQGPYLYPPGSHTFTAPVTGYWKFVGWGPGGSLDFANGGGSGGYFEITKRLRAQQTVAVVVGPGSSTTTDTTATFPDGTVATAGRANQATAGTASLSGYYLPTDVTLSGSTATGSNPGPSGSGTGGGAGGTGAGGGAGAPANSPFKGGAGGTNGATATAGSGQTPGGGAGNGNSPVGFKGGDGQVIAFLVRE